MKKNVITTYIILLTFLLSGCGNPVDTPGAKSSADWAYWFVVWNGDVYEILEEEIKPDIIDKEIGEVKQYSDVEGIYGNGFSNKYPAGTKLFSVKGIERSDYIAIQIEGGIYIKAKDKGKYGR